MITVKENRKRVLWVIPCFQSVYPRPLRTFLAMAINSFVIQDEYQFGIMIPERQILHSAMNDACSALLASGFDAMIVCDDDCLPPPDAIPRLLKHYEEGRDFVAGVGYMRGFPHTTTIGRYFPEGPSIYVDTHGVAQFGGFEWVERLDDEPDRLVKADFCGFPIAMISRRAIEKIAPPWFGTEIDGGGCTHDVYFGKKAKDAGVQILVDRDIDCGHLTEAPIVTGQNRSLKRDLASAWEQATKAARAPEPPARDGIVGASFSGEAIDAAPVLSLGARLSRALRRR